MANENCEYPKCSCEIKTFTCDNYVDVSNPMFIGDYKQTTYKRRICKHGE